MYNVGCIVHKQAGLLTWGYLQMCEPSVSEYVKRDRYFDDCSWSSLVLEVGIEVPTHSMFPSEEGIPTEARNVFDGLNYLVNEMKLNGGLVSTFRRDYWKIFRSVFFIRMN